MPAVAGLRGTGDWATDERPKNFRETILFRQPNGMAPLTALLSKMGDESVDDPEFNWWEEQQTAIRVTETTGLAASAASTALTCSGGGVLALVPGDMLLVEKADQATYDNEIVKVVSVLNDNSAQLQRGFAGTTVAAIAASTALTRIGNAYAEGSGPPNASTRNPTKLTNYCQIFKTSYELTKTAEATRTRTGDPVANDKKRKIFDHSVAMEFAFMFGVKNEGTGSNGKPERTTGGVRQFITTNRTVFSTTPTVTTFLSAVYPVFDYSSGAGDERIVLCGNGFLNALNLMVANSTNARINFGETIKVYGMNLQKYVLPQGVLYFKTHPLLNTHARYNYSAFVLDPSAMRYRYLKGRDTRFEDNIQNNGEDMRKGQWITEAGLEFRHERTMAYLGNFTYP